MPRANRYYVPGHVWHLTHRCHNRGFLLRFAPDRVNWINWLREAVVRHGLSVLNFTVTHNHVHLIAWDKDKDDCIARSMQLIEGATAEAYNIRRNRSGAFWDGRYNASAIQPGGHLAQCMVYIDLNMVRAGVVAHPREWPHGGYRDLHSRRSGTRIVDWRRLCALLDIPDKKALLEWHDRMLDEALRKPLARVGYWTESVAVGDEGFVNAFASSLGTRLRGRTSQCTQGGHVHLLREDGARYGEQDATISLHGDNSVPWQMDVP